MQRDLDNEPDAGTFFDAGTAPLAPVNGHAADMAGDMPGVNPQPPADPQAINPNPLAYQCQGPRSPEQFDPFGPDSPDIVMMGQPRTAVYVNPWNAVLIRQESADGDLNADQCVSFRPEHLPALIAKLKTYLPQPAPKSRG